MTETAAVRGTCGHYFRCPYCRDYLRSALDACRKPECRAADAAYAARYERGCDDL